MNEEIDPGDLPKEMVDVASQFQKDRPRKKKLAEFCGWSRIYSGGISNCSDYGRPPDIENDFSPHHLPSYEDSLDAMREVEERIAHRDGMWQKYLMHLLVEVGAQYAMSQTQYGKAPDFKSDEGLFTLATASARCRFEAACKTIGIKSPRKKAAKRKNGYIRE